MKKEITILIPHYKTPDITKLCLRLLGKYTNLKQAEVIVIDNDSGDQSTEYLRSLNWIKLIERNPKPDDTPPLSHSRALDLAFEYVESPYVLLFHTDTLVRKNNWLPFLLAQIKASDDIAGIGSWKLELKPAHKRIAKKIEAHLESTWYGVIGKDRSRLEDSPYHQKYLRSHCALYRTDLLRQFKLTFSADKDTAGKVLHNRLVELGYRMIFLPPEVLSKYMIHLNHATMVLNPELGSRPRSIHKGRRRIRKILKQLRVEQVMADDHLDQPPLFLDQD